MTQKPFGVKQLNVIGVAGTPTIESAGSLNIGGQQVAITTNTSVTGVITATSFTGDGANITGISTSNITNYSGGGGGGSIAGIDTTGTSSFNSLDVTGVSTFSDNITTSGAIHIAANSATRNGAALKIGDNAFGDLNIYHTGTETVYSDQYGASKFIGGTWTWKNVADNKTAMNITVNGAQSLYYDNTLRFQTATNGITVYGDVTLSGSGSEFVGSGAGLTSIPSGELTGALPAIDGSALTNISVTESDTLATVTARGDTTTAEITAANFRSNDTTGDGSDVGFAIKYYITANLSSAYRFAGPGVLNSTDNPTLYFHRGFSYILENSTGTGHPFELRVSSGGAAYAPGGSFLTGSINGTQVLTVPFDAPNSIVYQCTLHGGMVGTINFVS